MMELPLLKNVITLCQSTALSAPAPPPLRMKVDATQLEEHEFKLWKIRAEHDVEAFLSRQAVMRDKDTQNYYKRVQHNVWRAQEAESAASSLFDPSHNNCVITLIPSSDERTLVSACIEVKKALGPE